MAKRRIPLDLGLLADNANDALNHLARQGYEKEVQTIRTFLIEQGENWKRTQRIQHQVAGKLARDLLQKEREVRKLLSRERVQA